jgi:hypothetical protein
MLPPCTLETGQTGSSETLEPFYHTHGLTSQKAVPINLYSHSRQNLNFCLYETVYLIYLTFNCLDSVIE